MNLSVSRFEAPPAIPCILGFRLETIEPYLFRSSQVATNILTSKNCSKSRRQVALIIAILLEVGESIQVLTHIIGNHASTVATGVHSGLFIKLHLPDSQCTCYTHAPAGLSTKLAPNVYFSSWWWFEGRDIHMYMLRTVYTYQLCINLQTQARNAVIYDCWYHCTERM